MTKRSYFPVNSFIREHFKKDKLRKRGNTRRRIMKWQSDSTTKSSAKTEKSSTTHLNDVIR